MQLIQASRDSIHSLLEQFGVVYDVAPFDESLYQECVDDAAQRGYPVGDDSSTGMRTYLRVGVSYAATTGAHLHHRPTQIWIAHITSCAGFVDDVAEHYPADLPNLYHFNERFIRKEPQGNSILDALADVIRRTSDLFRPLASHLITTSMMNFITGALLEHETKSMKILGGAQQYPTYQRALTGAADAFSIVAYPYGIPVNDYIQAIPEMGQFICDVNDVVSFYKEELVGETTNQVSTLAARTKKSKLEALDDLTTRSIDVYKRIIGILEGHPEACDAFKVFVAEYMLFHFSSPRYQIKELGLKSQ